MALDPTIINWDPISGSTGYLVEYKKEGDTSWTRPTVPDNPTLNTEYPISGLLYNTKYYYKITSTGASCGPVSAIVQETSPNTTTTTSTTTSSTTTTTTTGLPPLIDEFVDLGTPALLFYNPNDNLIYGIDTDTCAAKPASTDGSIFRFNPSTAISISDFIYNTIGGLPTHGDYNPTTNKIYFHGRKTGGMYIYNCSSQTFSPLIAYGASPGTSTLNRGSVKIINNKAYASLTDIGGFVVINCATDTRDTDFLPPNPNGYESFQVLQIGTELWCYQQGAASFPSRILIYDISNIGSGPIHTINNCVVSTDASGKYYGSFLSLDGAGTKVWFSCNGERTIKSISVSSRTIVDTINVDSEGKTNIFLSPSLHPSGVLYFSGRLADSNSDAGLLRTYQIDTVGGNILATFNQAIGSFTLYPASGNSYGVDGGVASFNVPNTGYDVDGKVLVFG